MNRILFALTVAASVVLGEGLNTGSMIDPSKAPNFNSCTDIANIVQNKPALLPTYSKVLEESGQPSYSVKGPVEVDVKAGTVRYKVYSSLTNDIAESPTYVNPLCSRVDPNEVKAGIDRETRVIRDEIQRMYDSADMMVEQAQKESEAKSDGKTKSDVLGQALSGNVENAQKAEEKVNNYTGGGQASSGMTSPHLGFMARINAVNNDLQTLVFLGSIVITLIGLGVGYISKKIQKRADHEDYIARFGLGVVMWFLLFTPANTYKYGNGEISQTRMQAIWGWVLDKGTGVANQLAGAAHHEQIRYSIQKSGGKNVQSQIEGAVRELAVLENQMGAYEGILHQCIQSYRVNDLAMAIGDTKSGGKRFFPTDEASVRMGEEDVYSRYLQPTVNQNSVYMSLPTCGKAEAEYRQLVAKKAELENKIDAAKELRFQEKYTSSAKQIVQDTTSAGWIGAAMLPVHHFIANSPGSQVEANLKPSVKNEKENIRTDCEEVDGVWDSMVCHLENIERALMPDSFMFLQDNFTELSTNNIQQAIAQKAVLFMVPGVSSIYEVVKDIFDWIPIIGAPFGRLWGFIVATDFALIIVNNLPFLVLIPVASIVIAMYYFEVFIYSITIPYVAAYAFSRNQWDHLLKHAVRGIMIALKPAMIVISMYAAVYVSDVVMSISQDMIAKQTSLLMQDNIQKNGTSATLMESLTASFDMLFKDWDWSSPLMPGFNSASFMGSFTVFIIQGLLTIITAVISVFIVVKIIISGPVMIMEMFGVRETDVASQMTEAVTSRGQKYEMGV